MQLPPLFVWALLPGCWAVVRGPGSVRGFRGTTISVNCTYKAGQEMKPKFWCSSGQIFTCSDDIVITSELQPVVQQGRVSIQDNRARQVFTVTIENLTKRDEGTYLCGVRTNRFWFDERVPVEVIVASVPTQTTPEGKAVQPTSNIFHHKGSSPPPLDVVEHILTPGIVVVLLLLAVAAGILVILSRKRKKALSGAAVEMDRTHGASHMEADALNYAEINHPMHTAESQLYSNTQAFHCLANTTSEYMEVKQSDKCLEEKKEATCTTVQHSPPEQQEIYANVPSAAARRV
ncbi:CMRF35-like molecule 9 isoform X2 [Tyto alba]|uniref:CMRF35-like molecule 9 isoform X2 n=1 Tax=Tyto alba TaxID=56313 RepID=UPI001C6729E5|nr:CMRF35-like molecule 9 isoform X2 [Tyto alba]